MIEVTVKVRFFDGLNGLGEGILPNGQTVYLSSDNIIKDGRFVTLNLAEEVICDLEERDGKLYAKKILRSKSHEIIIEEDITDSFIEPQNVDL